MQQYIASQFPDKEIKSLYKIFNILKKNSKGWCHLSYSLELPNKRKFYFYTNPEWEKKYIDEKLIDHCPLVRACRKSRFIIPWSSVLASNEVEKKVLNTRRTLAAYDGIAMSDYFCGAKEMCGLGVSKKYETLVYHNIQNQEFILAIREKIRKIMGSFLERRGSKIN